MIDGLRPYSVVKDSGSPRLGEVPAHWTAQRLRTVAEMRVSSVDKIAKDGERPVRLCNYVDVYKHDRIRDRMTFMSATATESEIERFRLAVGDVLITKDSESWDDIGVPALVEESADDLISGYHLALLRPAASDLTGGYLFRALQSRPVAYQFHVEANGVTRYGLSHAAIKAVTIPVPPVPEQEAIVRFLDHADRPILRYIAAKKRLIALLNEQKQAIIHRAATRGLDPNVRFKPSGAEWLGDVPEHWQVVRLGSLLRERGEKNDSGAVTDVLSLLRARGVIPYDEKGNVGNKKSDDITRYKVVRPNDIVVNCMNVIIGSVGLSRYTGCLSPVYYVLMRRSELDDPEYLNAVFQCPAFHKSLVRIGNGILAHRMRIPMELLKCELMPYPPPEEQVRIVRALSEMTRDCDVAINRMEREVDLVREYRTRLISDVVTGKLDVRETSALLPDEVEEADLLDDTDVLAESDESEDEADLDAVAGEVVA